MAGVLIRSGPRGVAIAGKIVPPAPSTRERATQHVAEVPRLGARRVLDQTEEIGARVGERAGTSYSENPSIFQSIVWRTSRRSLSKYSLANSSITARVWHRAFTGVIDRCCGCCESIQDFLKSTNIRWYM